MTGGDAGDSVPQPKKPLVIEASDTISKLGAFAQKNFFLLGMIVAVSSAKLFPHVSVTSSFTRARNILRISMNRTRLSYSSFPIMCLN
jgi:hypothetical protein